MKTFVITGTLKSGTRDEIARRVAALGGRVVTAMSGNVDYVVSGSDVVGTRKRNAAAAHGTPIISEAEMWRILRAPKSVAKAVRPAHHVPLRVYTHTRRGKTRVYYLGTRHGASTHVVRSPGRRSPSAHSSPRRVSARSPYGARATRRSPYV